MTGVQTCALPIWSFNSLISVFEKLAEDHSESILIISHQERILNIADRIIVIADGKVAKDGLKEEVLPNILSASSACAILENKVKEA